MNVRFPTRTRAIACTFAALALAVAGCDPLEPIDPGNTQIEVWLTDAASAYMQEVNVDVGRVSIVPLSGATIDLAADGTPGPVDLIRLRDQRPLEIAVNDVEPGPYTQLQIELESASVQLKASYAFRDGTTSRALTLPTGALALNLDVVGIEDDSVGSLVIQPGQLALVVDVDVNQSLLFQGDPEAVDGIEDIIFDPQLRVVAQAAAGSVSGTVYTGTSGISPAGLVVIARPLTQSVLGAYQTRTATTLTGPDGAYTIPYMAAGRYAVNVEVPPGYTTAPGITEADLAARGSLTGFDFQIIPASAN